MAHIVVAYLCWFFGGLFGLHHFYLGRDKHAFVWFISLGGFGMGWLRDLWRLPEYVFEANRDQRFLNEFAARRQHRDKPPFNIVRFAGQIMIGCILSHLFRVAIPEKGLMESSVGMVMFIILPIMGTAVGVSLVANIGQQKVALKYCLVGAAMGLPWLLMENPSLPASSLFASILASKYCEWDPDKETPKGCCNFMKRAITLSLCCLIYFLLWSSVIYYNAHVTTRDGTEVPIHEAVDNFFDSPAWKEMKKTFWDLYEFCQINGWENCYHQFVAQIDPTGESHAYQILEFNTTNPTAEEIKQQCRKLGRKWHPDKYKTEEEKMEAQEKFIEVQKACDILNDLRKKRTEKNMQSDTTTSKPGHEHEDL